MAREIKIAILGDARDFTRAVKTVQGDADRLRSGFANVAKSAAIGAGAMAVGAAAIAKGFVQAAEESQKVTAQTGAVIKSMGNAANVTASQVAKLSTKLSLKTGIDDELIQSGANVLLTFGNIRNELGKGNDIFDRSNKAALDMSVALGTDMKSAAMQVGKALNDPVRGLAALRRSGIQFTKQQEDQIKAMVAAGDAAGAQKIMLGELERQFGGSAAAQATASDRLRVAWGNVQEQLGAKLLPVVEKFATFLANNLPAAVEKATATFRAISDFVAENKAQFTAVAVVVGGALTAAFLSWAASAAAAAAATIAAALPVLAIGAAVAALAAGVIYAYEHWDWFRSAVDKVARFMRGTLWPALQAVAGWVTGTMVPAIGRIISTFGDWIGKAGEVASTIKGKLNDLVGFVTGLPGRIGSAASGMWDGIKNAFRSAINWIIRAWNKLEFKIPGFDPPGPGPSFGGFTLGVPNIPQLAKGGIVTRPTLALIGEAGPEAVVPLGGGSGRFSGPTEIHLHNHGIIGNRAEMQRWVLDALAEAKRRGAAGA